MVSLFSTIVISYSQVMQQDWWTSKLSKEKTSKESKESPASRRLRQIEMQIHQLLL